MDLNKILHVSSSFFFFICWICSKLRPSFTHWPLNSYFPVEYSVEVKLEVDVNLS